MISRLVNLITARLLPAYRLQNAPAPVVIMEDSPPSESWFFFFLRGIASFCLTAASKVFMSNFQRVVVAQLQRFGEKWHAGPPAIETPRDLVAVEQAPPTRTTPPKKAFSNWSYMRGVALALGELCLDGQYGGDRIPLSAILDLMRQHQSAFVPLGPHAERDVPKRLIELANDGIVIYDPFQEHVIVPEVTRQKYALKRQELFAQGVDPANLSVYGARFTRGLFKSERVTNAGVASYKERFLRTQGQMGNRSGAALTRHESLMSIADAICPARLMPEVEVAEPDKPEGSTRVNAIVRRGHSIVTDIARIITSRPPDSSQEGTAPHAPHGSELRRGLSILPEMTGIIHERDSLETKQNRLRTILETSD